jgi:hypothetical protein
MQLKERYPELLRFDEIDIRFPVITTIRSAFPWLLFSVISLQYVCRQQEDIAMRASSREYMISPSLYRSLSSTLCLREVGLEGQSLMVIIASQISVFHFLLIRLDTSQSVVSKWSVSYMRR